MQKLISQLYEFDSAEISDALDACGIEGVLLGLKPIQPGLKMIGPAYTVKYEVYEKKPTDFQNAGNYIDEVPNGAIIVVDNSGREDCSTWGDILTDVAMQKEIAGTVVYGAVRDVESIRATQYPLFSKAITMRSGKNRVYLAAKQIPIMINHIEIKPNDIIFADENGVLIIPQRKVEQIIALAKNIQACEANIRTAIKAGSSLQKARQLFRYDQPWTSQ